MNQTQLNDLLDFVSTPLFVINSKNECLFSNRAFCELLCNEKDLQLSVSEFWPDFHELDICDGKIETVFYTKAGDRLKVTLLGKSANGFWLFKILNGQDAKSVLLDFHTQRLQTLGMLAGGVAHDFNNILTGILGHITYLKAVLPASGGHQQSLVAIEDGAKKASQMTQQILNFSRLKTEKEPSVLDLNRLVEKTFDLLKRAISPKLKLQMNLANEDVLIKAVEGKLAQVLVNLVINARDAINGEGVITVRVISGDNVERDEFEIDILTNQDKRFALLSVKDDGQGMSKSLIKRVFEPYFSTKEGGTGLGLATVLEIVKSFSGGVKIRSQEGSGTEVLVYFPLHEGSEEVDLTTKGQSEMDLKGGQESILIVDDEDPVRNVLSVSLSHLGYRVDTAASGKEAIEKFESNQAQYDLCLIDMLMPNISGESLFYTLREFRGDLKVLLISGYSSEEAVKKILNSGGKGFIQKPFTIEELSQKVRECLDS